MNQKSLFPARSPINRLDSITVRNCTVRVGTEVSILSRAGTNRRYRCRVIVIEGRPEHAPLLWIKRIRTGQVYYVEPSMIVTVHRPVE